jgi:hypothetical protein
MGVRSAAGGRRPVGVAVAGFGWMGRVHTQAYARVLHHFPELTLTPELVAVADAARQAGVQGTVGSNYRNAPAVAAA